jgi:hypothetical protein
VTYRQRVPFEVFWQRLKDIFLQAHGPEPGVHVLKVRKWSQHTGEMPGEFVVIYRSGETVACDTASTDGIRQVSAAEFRKVYEIWEDYRMERKGRSFIAQDLGVQNTTWIIPILYRNEHLMY